MTDTEDRPIRLRILLFWLTGIALATALLASSVRIQTDLSQFLPESSSIEERVLLHQLREGAAARLLLAAIEGRRSKDVIAEASTLLAAKLSGSPAFSWVANGDMGSLDHDATVLFGHRYLIGPPSDCVDALSETGLRKALTTRLAELQAPFPPPDKQRIPADPTACLRGLLVDMMPHTSPRRINGVWFSPDGERTLLVLRTNADASDLVAQRAAVEEIRQAFASLPGAEGLRLLLSGPGFFSVGSEETIRIQTTRLTIGASLLVALILLLSFRSIPLVLLGMLPLATGMLAGALVAAWVFGSLHGITLALGITLLGVAMDYPVHVFSHVTRCNGTASADRGIWRTLFLGVATTTLGYAALALTGFQGLAQLGLLAAVGLAAAALSARLLLPTLMPDTYRLPERAWIARCTSAISPPISKLRFTAALLAVGIPAAVMVWHPAPWDSDLARLSTIPESDLALDRKLRGELGAPDVSRLFFVIGDDRETVLRKIESVLPHLRVLVDEGWIRDFDAAARWLPSQQAQQERRGRLPDRARLEQSLAVAADGLPFQEGLFAPFLNAVEQARAQAPLQYQDVAATVIGARIAPLLQPFGEQWIGLIPLIGVDDAGTGAVLHALSAEHALHFLDLRAAAMHLLDGFIDETLENLVLAGLIICAVLALGLRNHRRLGQVLLPIGVTLALDFSILVALEGSVNLFHLISLLLVLGLSIDYSLFFARPCTSPAECGRTFFALSVCALSSFAMFGMLALSSIPVLHAIGSTVAIGIALAFPLAFLFARNDTVR